MCVVECEYVRVIESVRASVDREWLTYALRADIDDCAGVQCGGPSQCVDGVSKFVCMCADGWRGGGDNRTCIGMW